MLILLRWSTCQYDNPILLDATKSHTNEDFQNFVWGFKRISILILRVGNATSSWFLKKFCILSFEKKKLNIVIHFPIIYK